MECEFEINLEGKHLISLLIIADLQRNIISSNHDRQLGTFPRNTTRTAQYLERLVSTPTCFAVARRCSKR